MSDFYIGIDPGKSGGLAVLDASGKLVEAYKMPLTLHDLANYFWCKESFDAKVALERVNAGVWGKGKEGQRMGVTSAFTFGRSYGALEGVVAASGFPMVYVTPRVWQAKLGCLTGGNKNISKAAAQQRWPSHKWTHATADAALIAEWLRITDK